MKTFMNFKICYPLPGKIFLEYITQQQPVTKNSKWNILFKKNRIFKCPASTSRPEDQTSARNLKNKKLTIKRLPGSL